MEKLKRRFRSTLRQYILAVTVIAATAALCIPLSDSQNYHVVSFILLFAVSLLSTFLGVGPVLTAATLSALVWNFLFIPPHLTFHIGKTEDILIFGLFFIIALVNGILTTRVRRQEKLAREREKTTNSLFQLTRELSKASGMAEVISTAADEIRNHFGVDPDFYLQDGKNKLSPSARRSGGVMLSPTEYEAATTCFLKSERTGAFTVHYPGIKPTFFPLPGARINPGVLAVVLTKNFSEEQVSYWEAFIAQISNALEREFLGELAQKVRFLDESDRLYRTLFNSISHEFRIPVATIMGASDSILNSSNSAATQAALCQEIFSASLRLNRLIENLLNISRLESGHISVRLKWCDINDLFNKVTEDLREELKPFELRIVIPEDLPMVKIDFGLMEQVLYNLIYNATQHSPATSAIEILAGYSCGKLLIRISDNGPGLSQHDTENLFRKFYRAPGSSTGGLGLGLSIARGFVEAHNGTITGENNPGGGACFRIEIPTEEPQWKEI